jgi:hypothetical protein
MAHEPIYRGYLIQVSRVQGWSFSAQPTTPFLPILPHAVYSRYVSSEAAIVEAKMQIDRLLAI